MKKIISLIYDTSYMQEPKALRHHHTSMKVFYAATYGSMNAKKKSDSYSLDH